MSSDTSFIDTNVWLYRLFYDNKMEVAERTRKRNIAIAITEAEGIIISTQVVNEVAANLLKKAAGSIHFWKKHRAIGNRGYTNEVRLRGLSETRAGGFSLYSPRLLVGNPPKRDAPKQPLTKGKLKL
ncbi:hypothetical protein [Nostoc sp.]|uniref:hypothetical protein n=1 Tax=Nostoc sp. TaxID=1180 RepID=UPI002FFB0905